MTKPSPPANESALFALFDQLAISHRTMEHEATFTVAESREVKTDLPGGHSKNLFMRDKEGRFVLLSAHADARLALNKLHREMGTGRLSFASAEELETHLGIKPGSVTPFALINDPDHRVSFALEASLAAFDTLNFHPLRNDRTTAIGRADFDRFLSHLGRPLKVVDIRKPEA